MTTPDIAPLLDWYQQLTPVNLARIGEFYADDARFKDPFNDVTGSQAIADVFQHMFNTTSHPRFTILEVVQQDNQAFITWDFDFTIGARAYHIHGASQLKLNEQGKVFLHRDYWDSSEELWQKVPLIGWPLRWLHQRLKTPVKP